MSKTPEVVRRHSFFPPCFLWPGLPRRLSFRVGPPDGDDLAEDAQSIVGPNRDRSMLRVFRSQFDFLVTDDKAVSPWPRLPVTRPQCHRFPPRLLAHHHQVAFSDTGVHHAVPGHLKGETPTRPSDPAFDQYLADDVFLGQNRLAGRHPADDGDGHQIGDIVILGIAQDDNAAGLSRLRASDSPSARAGSPDRGRWHAISRGCQRVPSWSGGTPAGS